MEFEESEQSDRLKEKEEQNSQNKKLSLEDYKEFIIQMRRTNLHLQQICSIPQGELIMLIAINRLAEQNLPVRVSNLGNVLRLSKPAVSRMLHVLQKKGYIQMKTGKEDQRYVFVEFTEKGSKLMQAEMGNCNGLLKRVSERMGENDMQKFLYYNNKFCTILAEELL